MMDKATNAILIQGTTITQIKSKTIQITTITITMAQTMTTKMIHSIGHPRNSIGKEKISRRNLEQGEMPATIMANIRKKDISGALMTSTTVSIKSMSKNSTDSKRNTTDNKRMLMKGLVNLNRVRMRPLVKL